MTFERQFLVTQHPCDLGDGFNHQYLSGQHLYTHRDLPVIRLTHGDVKIGFLLGWVIDITAAKTVVQNHNLDHWDSDAFDKSVEDCIYHAFAGSFIFISQGSKQSGSEQSRLYLDCNGTLSAVYDANQQKAGATAEIILGDCFEEEINHTLIAACEVKQNGWITAGLTAHEPIRRLLANHYLNLKDFTVKRHWPTHAHEESDSPFATVREIAQEINTVVTALNADSNVYVTLTGGNETRAILASLRSIAKHLTFATIDVPNTQMDLTLSKRLATKFGLKHLIVPLVLANTQEMEVWDRRVGYCLTGANRAYHPTVRALADGITVGGLGGEVGRCFLWPNAEPSFEVTATMLTALLKLPQYPVVVNEISIWLENVPRFLNTSQILDIAYLELRMSAWAYAQSYANPDEVVIQPLTSRLQYQRMFSLDNQFRWNNGLISGIINELWPELNMIPINAYGNFRDKLQPIEKLIREPKRAVAKLRQIMSRTK